MKKILLSILMMLFSLPCFSATVNYDAIVSGDYSNTATVFLVNSNQIPSTSGVTVWLFDSTQYYSPETDQYAEACSLTGASATAITVVRPSNADFIGGVSHTYKFRQEIVNPTASPTPTSTPTYTPSPTFTPTFTSSFTPTVTNTPTPGLSTSGPLSVGGPTSLVGNQFLNGIETTLFPYSNYIYLSPVLSQTLTTFNPVSGTAYFVYVGDVASAFTPQFVRLYDSTPGTESSVEVGIFSSPAPPNAANQTLTKITSGVVTTNLSTGIDKNASAFVTALTAGNHIWIGVLMTWSVQPVTSGLCNDFGNGSYLVKTSASTFASQSSYAATYTSTMSALTGVCPDLVLTNN